MQAFFNLSQESLADRTCKKITTLTSFRVQRGHYTKTCPIVTSIEILVPCKHLLYRWESSMPKWLRFINPATRNLSCSKSPDCLALLRLSVVCCRIFCWKNPSSVYFHTVFPSLSSIRSEERRVGKALVSTFRSR